MYARIQSIFNIALPYVSEALLRGFVFSRLAASAAARAANADLLNGYDTV